MNLSKIGIVQTLCYHDFYGDIWVMTVNEDIIVCYSATVIVAHMNSENESNVNKFQFVELIKSL